MKVVHTKYLTSISSNVACEWLTLLLRIRKVPASDLGPKTDYPDWDISWYSSVIPRIYRDNNLNYATSSVHILSKPLFRNHTIIWTYSIESELLTTMLNKPQISYTVSHPKLKKFKTTDIIDKQCLPELRLIMYLRSMLSGSTVTTARRVLGLLIE
jgi:hypothetical protein